MYFFVFRSGLTLFFILCHCNFDPLTLKWGSKEDENILPSINAAVWFIVAKPPLAERPSCWCPHRKGAGPSRSHQGGWAWSTISDGVGRWSSRVWPPGGGRPVDVSACMLCDGVSGAGGGGGGEDEKAVVGSGSPRPPRRQHRGGTPVPTPSEASGRSQQYLFLS
jgi:hypothetical protein